MPACNNIIDIYIQYIYIYIHIAKSVCCVERDVFREICSLARGLCITIHAWVLARKVTSSFEIEQKLLEKRIFFFLISIYLNRLRENEFFDFLIYLIRTSKLYLLYQIYFNGIGMKKIFLLFFSFHFGWNLIRS